MSSGVRFVEEYSGRDDVSMLGRRHVHADRRGGRRRGQTFQHAGRASRHQVLLCLRRDAVLGLVLRRAVGLPVADYLHDKLWAPMGAEADATWLIDRSDQEATLSQRGAARLRAARLLLAHGGQRRGQQVIPAGWLEDATSVRPDQLHLQPGIATPFFGYGYQTWIFPGQQRRFFSSVCGARRSTSIRPAGWSWSTLPSGSNLSIWPAPGNSAHSGEASSATSAGESRASIRARMDSPTRR
jgi:CubicO group peptidase (beta-lactamase class C family)